MRINLACDMHSRLLDIIIRYQLFIAGQLAGIRAVTVFVDLMNRSFGKKRVRIKHGVKTLTGVERFMENSR